MEIFPLLQARLLFFTVLIGLSTGALFDLSEQIVSVLKKRFSLVAEIFRVLGDFFIAASAGVISVILCYYFNRGEIRAFCVIGLGMGLGVYFGLMSKAVKTLYALVFRVIFFIFRLIFHPLYDFAKKLLRNLQIVLYYVIKSLAKKVILVYNIYVKKSIFKGARKGFLKGRFK